MAADGNTSQLVGIVTLLGAAVVGVPLFKRLGLGAVLGYLAAGLVIGPFGMGLLTDAQTIIHVAELGVVMFLFVIGLEMKPSHLWGLRGQIFGLGSMQVVLSALLLTGVGVSFGFPWQVAFISGAGFVLTSTAIVMQVLAERGDLHAPQGQRIVSILLFEACRCWRWWLFWRRPTRRPPMHRPRRCGSASALPCCRWARWWRPAAGC